MNKEIWDKIIALEEMAHAVPDKVWEYEYDNENLKNSMGQRFGVVPPEYGKYIAAANPGMMLELFAQMRGLNKKLNDARSKIGNKDGRIKMLEASLDNLRREFRMLEKEADWLATWCADACAKRYGNCYGCSFNEQYICPIENDEIFANKPDIWLEAARKAVKDETNA